MAVVERTTKLALEEKSKLHKSLRRFDLLFFTVCAFVGLDTLGLVAQNGPQGFTWLIVLAVLFVAPYALIMSEVGAAFTQEGGPYEWTKMAFGRLHASVAAVLYWVTNPLWVGGSLAFIATQAWNDNLFSVGSSGSFGDYLFKLLFIWFSIGVAIASLKRGKWIPNAGAFMRLFVMGFFTFTLIIYAISHGVHGFPVSQLKPTGAVFLGLAPVLLFNYVGFELGNGAAEEMQDPQRDVPVAVARSAVIGVLLYAIPIFGIILVLPPEAISGIGGFLDAVSKVFGVYGSAKGFLLGAVTLAFVGTLLTSGAVWMIGSDRILAVAAYDGAFAPYFGRFNARLGTPVRVNTLSGITSTIFMVVAVAAFNGGADSKFAVVLTIAISTTLISYLWIFPAVLKLRYSYPGVHRPYRVPGGTPGIWIATGLATAWVALGSWVAVFPGTLESLLGVDYNFLDTWGVQRSTFEALALGTLAAVLVISLVGYWMGREVRQDIAELPLDPLVETPA
ncbi:MAG: glutamate:GABA antiporter [Baekduia sp.]|jgi:amino acid transporter|nr:glutamate:GABA antiporter [Baekduia sp.]